MNDIGVVIAEDQVLLRKSLVRLMSVESDLHVLGEAANGVEAVQLVAQTKPDVVLMDIRMPELDGIAATSAITSDPRNSSTKILVLTMFALEEYVFRALRAGAFGFLLKDTSPGGIINAVRTTYAGHSMLSPSVLGALVERFAPPPPRGHGLEILTKRQTEILTLIGRGLSNTEIEESLCISHATLKTHVAALLSRLAARDRTQLVIAAYEHGLVGQVHC